MALTYINGGGIRIDGETPAFAVIEYEDGLSSDIPDAPPALTPEEEKIEEQAEEEQKQEEEKKEEEKKEEEAQQATGYECSKKSANVKYGGYGTVQRHATPSDDDICLTKWHSNFSRCKKFAEKNGLPMVVVWSNGEQCGHCCTFASAVSNKVFREFQQTYKVVWCYLEGSDSDAKEGSSAYNWCWGSLGFFPFVNFYWKKGSKVILHQRADGDAVDGQVSGAKGAKKAIAYIKKKFSSVMQKNGYNPNA